MATRSNTRFVALSVLSALITLSAGVAKADTQVNTANQTSTQVQNASGAFINQSEVSSQSLSQIQTDVFGFPFFPVLDAQSNAANQANAQGQGATGVSINQGSSSGQVLVQDQLSP